MTIQWFSLQGDDGVMFHTVQPLQGALTATIELAGQTSAGDQPVDKKLLTSWDSGTPSLEAAAQTIGLTQIAHAYVA